MINYEIVGDIVVASGDNWKYTRVGASASFTQSGKVPSLRVIKTMIKLLDKVSKKPINKDVIFKKGNHQYLGFSGGGGCAGFDGGAGFGGGGSFNQ